MLGFFYELRRYARNSLISAVRSDPSHRRRVLEFILVGNIRLPRLLTALLSAAVNALDYSSPLFGSTHVVHAWEMQIPCQPPRLSNEDRFLRNESRVHWRSFHLLYIAHAAAFMTTLQTGILQTNRMWAVATVGL
jgi:hypothetical protein